MNKGLLGFFVLVVLLFWAMTNYTSILHKPINGFFNSVKNSYMQTLANIQESIDEHFFQAETIQTLSDRIQKCKKERLVMHQLQEELHNIKKLHDANLSIDPRVQLVRAVSYEKFGNLNHLWMDVADYNASKIYGLVYNQNVAGIIIAKENMPLALLLRDPKCSYAVSIGKEEAPGIAHGNNDKNIIVTFIPTWYNIEVGDEVRTSGLDNIFFKNLKVGRVVSLTTSQGYIKAVVKPYFTSMTNEYFYMIEKTK